MAEFQSHWLRVADTPEAVNRLSYHMGWTDGLPVVPPTPKRVREMLERAGRDASEAVGRVPPKWGDATIEKIAINAVMAGCLPEYLPVVIAAVEGVVEPQFNLYAIQATTNPAAPLIVVDGPLAKELEINSACNALGQGRRANATIGRALRFVLLNVGGGKPGVLDRATAGQPGKYTFCIAENEEDSPWTPLRVERGFPAEASAVTVVGASGTLNILDMGSQAGEEVLTTIAGSMAHLGSNDYLLGGGPLILLSPEHAALVAGDGYGKQEVKSYLFDHTKIPLGRFAPGNRALIVKYRSTSLGSLNDDSLIPLADRPEDIVVVVVGGPGPHSVLVPTFGETKAVTKPIRK
jgi:hypothetical protein